MTGKISAPYTVHLSELDEFLASRLLEEKTSPLCFSISILDSQGNINICQKTNGNKIEEGGIDFELSPSEYQSLDSINILDFTKSTVYTSSSYEFFDFILMYFSSLECLLDFSGNSWRVKVQRFTEKEESS